MTPQRVYRGLLWLYPSAFRREYGEDMVEAFGEALRDDRRGRLRFWVTVVVDLVRSASREHWRTGGGVTMISRTRIAGLAVLAMLLTAGLMWTAWVVVTQDQGLPIEQTQFRVDVDSMEGGQSARFSADTSGAPTSVRTARGEWRALGAGEELVTPVTLTIPPGPFVAQFTSLGSIAATGCQGTRRIRDSPRNRVRHRCAADPHTGRVHRGQSVPIADGSSVGDPTGRIRYAC